MGLFARQWIPQGTRIIEYVGRRITKEESLRACEAGNVFIFSLNDTWDIDGDVPWNPARFVNHSCAPNCEVENLAESIWIVARRSIEPDEELTFNYGYDLESYRDYPCHCGAPDCVGYMVAEEFFPTLRERQAAS